MKKSIIFVFALLMAGLATFLFYQYTNQLSRQTSVQEPMKTVIAAAVPISKDQKITEEMLKKIEIPAKMVHTDAVLDAGGILGEVQYATSDIAADEVILKHHLQTLDAAEVLSGKIKEKNRAVTLPGGVVETLANMIEPEDMIDIIYTGPPLTPTADPVAAKIISTLVLQENVRVLAVGRRIQTSGTFVEYDSITVEAQQKEAVKIIKAFKTGSLNYILHSKRKTVETKAEGSS